MAVTPQASEVNEKRNSALTTVIGTRVKEERKAPVNIPFIPYSGLALQTSSSSPGLNGRKTRGRRRCPHRSHTRKRGKQQQIFTTSIVSSALDAPRCCPPLAARPLKPLARMNERHEAAALTRTRKGERERRSEGRKESTSK